MIFSTNEEYIHNIFQIRDNLFKISNFNKKKVKICSICDVILIPSRTDILESNLKDILWYSDEDYKTMRSSYITELIIIGRMNNVNFKDSIKIWKQQAINIYSSSTYVFPESALSS